MLNAQFFDDGEFLQDSGNKVKLKMVLGLT